jgi:RNA polymerase sigma-70 factor (ECF subfamily)
MNGVALLDQTMERVTMPLDDTVLAAQAGSPAAFAELYSIYSRRLFQTILSITRNPHDAEDALQETFLRAHLAIHTFEGKSQIYTWLTRIAVNTALMALRKQRVRPEVLFDPQPGDRCESFTFEVKDSAPNPEELCVLHQRQLKTLRAIHRLRPYLREPIRMQIMHGWSIKEISRELNVSESAVKSRLYRARQRLLTSCGDLQRSNARNYCGAFPPRLNFGFVHGRNRTREKRQHNPVLSDGRDQARMV